MNPMNTYLPFHPDEYPTYIIQLNYSFWHYIKNYCYPEDIKTGLTLAQVNQC